MRRLKYEITLTWFCVLFTLSSAAQVSSVTGTANQVITSGSTGAVTLSLPQDIGIGSGVRFGFLSLGSTASVAAKVTLGGLFPSVSTSWLTFASAMATSSNTQTVTAYGTSLATQAASFNLINMRHFYADQNTFGAGSSVLNQYGFYTANSLIGATNNYGFYGNIPSGAGRWNLYMNGTANNYLAGNLGIGITNPAEKLSVNGNIRAREIKVEVTGWPDYVFESSYQLPDLLETERFINQNRHLPGIPSSSEVDKEGLNLGEMNAKLLQKIEELTLYVIDLKKEIETLKSAKK